MKGGSVPAPKIRMNGGENRLVSSDLYILGIHDGHNCGATLTCNGEVVASVSEERLTRRKNDVGYPRSAIEDVLRIAGIGPERLGCIAIASLFMHKADYLTNLENWYKVGRKEQEEERRKPKEYHKVVFAHRARERVEAVTSHLGIDAARVEFVEHHLAHLAAAYYTAPSAADGRPILGLTCDGSGDGVAATVSLCQGNRIERIAFTERDASLGKIYSHVTYLLGMRPWEDEHKVMGLAPYGKAEGCAEAAKTLENLLKIDEEALQFSLATDLSTNYCYEYLREMFESVRFDTIAGAVQLFTEQLLQKWVRNCIRRTGLADVVCGGGVFMNVKANMRIAELPEVKSLYVVPSCGDESLSLGASLDRYYQMSGDVDHRRSVFDNLYWGGGFGEDCIRKAIGDALSGTGCGVRWVEDIDRLVAERVAAGEVVARFAGRMEWGARALGNRSILADPCRGPVAHEINKMIKMRDFWMPFAPSILDNTADCYLTNHKPVNSDAMMIAFEVQGERFADLRAASHPEDHTIRPQVLTHRANPRFYRLLEHFKSLTGRGALLNTSFNLHRSPMVYTPVDALEVFKKSGLRFLALENAFISKPNGYLS